MSESTTSTTADSKLIWKHLPEFDPAFYRQWRQQVKLAFDERGWKDHLLSPAELTAPLDPAVATRAFSFIIKAIPFIYLAGIEGHETAYTALLALAHKHSAQSP